MSEDDDALMVRAAWFYYVGGLNQEMTAARLGLTRARVNKMLAEARESGLVSISIDHQRVGVLPLEDKLRVRFGLDFCISTPAFGFHDTSKEDSEVRKQIAFRAVGVAAANHLKTLLSENDSLTVGTGWGRTIEQMTLHLAGVRAPHARFISVMGSLTANNAYNPFEVVHSLARRTGGEGYFLPVPFIADSIDDKKVLISQRSVVKALEIARSASVCFISAGELTEDSLLRRQGMISSAELESLRQAGAVGDTNGIFFDSEGRQVDHELNERTIALGFEELKALPVLLLIAGGEKVQAARALLRSGVINGLIIDGDAAEALAAIGG
ncbi:sugar-binding transcriptional regulator [Sinorhizobium meliloti WSM1022]|jgi:DNA-binding transcriptional regulator LsrR (DeoR family)|uniref:sugar-binding transcriptional regulator n=1 Tax=Rhizobium meliloti TaxID=382 RepID=UPI000419A89D|nr:sugar-binding transcriptional regulator [Sinorhizobium meliloti]ASQ02566.1 DNA-binding transcriptional regulator [Sinorhizobium meliloti]MCO6422511.1 sugar-binding transcriptional regulator [Sinorhizobium meliloti]MDW9411560.1 sugar-binding transcriptional regulator [Sinorhizobium meliloti]MDW9441752.1 sugar-binding transcriptional regulator [Sinorhizobium meliloti]MDW9457103.1 sugar-binding transcriptional regulator [Sinorhizobium meliloti]